MKHSLLSIVLLSSLALSSCVDTTGLSPDSSRKPKGNLIASVSVVEYADLQCEACRAVQAAVIKPLLEKYGDRIRFEFRHFPILTSHPYALDAAQAAECAADQGRFWEFVDIAYSRQDALNRKVLPQWAKDAWVQDTRLFSRCLASGIKKATVMSDLNAGKEQGVEGTPTFFVNGKKVEATVPALGTAIEEAVARITSIRL